MSGFTSEINIKLNLKKLVSNIFHHRQKTEEKTYVVYIFNKNIIFAVPLKNCTYRTEFGTL